MRFSMSTARKKVRVEPRPVGDVDIGPQAARQIARHGARLEQVLELQTHAAHLLAHAVELLRVFEIDQRKPGVILVMVDRENPDHGELPQPRQDAGRRHLPLRRDQHHFVADRYHERPRQLDAEHDAEFPGFSAVRLPAFMWLREIGDFFLVFGNYAADIGAAHCAAARQQPLCRHVGRGRNHLLVLRGLGRNGTPVGERVVRARDLDMRSDAEDARAHFALKTVHHRQHRDQHRDAERDADHRHQGNERDETAALPRARVAQTDEEFVRLQDRCRLRKRKFATMPAPRHTARGRA